MLLADKISIMPFARILPPFMLGILLHRYVAAPDRVVALVAVAVYAAAWRQRHSRQSWWYLSASLMLTGILLTNLHATRRIMPRNERLLIVVEADRVPVVRGRWQQTTARAGWFRPDQRNGRSWARADERIELWVDTACTVRQGDQLAVRAYVNPIDTGTSRYGALMRSRGIDCRTYVAAGSVVATLRGGGRRLTGIASRMQEWAVKRLGRLPLDEPERSMLGTLVAGEKRGMDRQLKADYARAGVAHILAVSGLHTGFVLIFLNLLLGWVVLLRRGHLAKNLLVILALWAYALTAGLSPPVVRSALMLTAAQIALGMSARGNGFNIVLGTATAMLAIRPSALFDVSFQLSFLAVLSILFFYPRLYRRQPGRNRLADVALSSLMLTLAAQIGTLPAVAYHFGSIPLLALPVNPVVIATAFAAVCCGLAWLLLPLPFLAPLLAAVVHASLWIQTRLVTWIAAQPYAAVQRETDGVWALAAYGLLGLAAGIIEFREDKKTGMREAISSATRLRNQ